MGKFVRVAGLIMLSLAIMAGTAFAACSKGQAELKIPTVDLSQYSKGTAVDFDEATINQISESSGELGFKTGTAAAIYPTMYYSTAKRDQMAQTLFGSVYKIGDGVSPTTYAQLTDGDKLTVDLAIFAGLSATEQEIVINSVAGFFNRQDIDTSSAESMEQNTAYGILYSEVSPDAANAWAADATAWMTALNKYAAANYDNETYAQLTLAEKAAVRSAMTIIDPETAFYRAMASDSFRNGTASNDYPDERDAITAAQYPGKAYATLNPVLEQPVVDAMVWAQLTDDEKAVVNSSVAGLFTLATAQYSDPVPLTSNVCYTTLLYLPVGGGQAVADAWAAAVEPTVPGTGAEATEFYTLLGAGDPVVGQATWKAILTAQYYGPSASYDTLSDASKAVIDQADAGMMGLATVQRLPPLPLSSNILYTTLSSKVSATAATGWMNNVSSSKNMEWMFYKWLVFETFRNGTTSSFYPTTVDGQVAAANAADYITASTYAACNAYEKTIVDGMVWAAIGTAEQSYVQNTALPGMFGLVQAEMTDAVALDQTICYLTLQSTVTTTAANHWKADVDAGVDPHQAFYRWLSKETVSESAATAVYIQLGVAEFDLKISNPNDYEISLDKLDLIGYVKSSTTDEAVEAAKQSLTEKIWVPANEEITVPVLAPVKTMDMITSLIISGKQSDEAMALAADVWGQIQAGTADWDVSVDIVASSKSETVPETYTLTWTAS